MQKQNQENNKKLQHEKAVLHADLLKSAIDVPQYANVKQAKNGDLKFKTRNGGIERISADEAKTKIARDKDDIQRTEQFYAKHPSALKVYMTRRKEFQPHYHETRSGRTHFSQVAKQPVTTAPTKGNAYTEYIRACRQPSRDPNINHLKGMISQFNTCKDPKVANDVYAQHIDSFADNSKDPRVGATMSKLARMATHAASVNTDWGRQHIGTVRANMPWAHGKIRDYAKASVANKQAARTVQNNVPQTRMARHDPSKVEDYIPYANVDKQRTKTTGKPFVDIDPIHRADVNPKSPYAGKHVMSYIDKNGHMTHTQVISGKTFNFIRKLNHKKPFTFKNFMHHMRQNHPLVNAAMDAGSALAFRAKTFTLPTLPQIRGHATHFIKTATLKATHFAFHLKREMQAHMEAKRFRMRQLEIKMADNAKRPYDAFNIVSPKEMRSIYGDSPKNYNYAQDYFEAHNPKSVFNKNTPNELDHKGINWRPDKNRQNLSQLHRYNRRSFQNGGPAL